MHLVRVDDVVVNSGRTSILANLVSVEDIVQADLQNDVTSTICSFYPQT